MKCDNKCFSCKYKDCIRKIYESRPYSERPEEQKIYQHTYQKQKRDEAREKGLCIICRKKERKYGAKCYECYIRQKRYDRKKNKGVRQQRKEEGLCYFCGAPRFQDKKVCERCYKRGLESVKRLNEHPNTNKGREKIRRIIHGEVQIMQLRSKNPQMAYKK